MVFSNSNMSFCKKQVIVTLTIFYVVLLAFTTGDGIQKDESITTTENTPNNETSKTEIEYDNDDNPDYDNDGSKNETNISDYTTDDTDDSTQKTVSQSSTATRLSTVLENGTNTNTFSNESLSSSTQSISTVKEINESESPIQQTTSEEIVESDHTAETDDDSLATENLNLTSSSKISTTYIPITTQDLADDFNYTVEPIVDMEPARGRTWAVVTTSVLVSFAVIFTILFFIRAAVIRRRKDDQRRLLRGSISSEGYFYGDSDVNTDGKFEL